MIPRRALIFCFRCLCCAAVAAYGQSPQTIFLPPVNLAATETAQIEITSSAAAYVGQALLTTCNAALTFYGAGGSVIGTPAHFTIADTRQIFSVELPYASAGAGGLSTAISARIALTITPFTGSVLAPPMPPCALAYSLRTFDSATAVTHAFVTSWAAQGTTLGAGAAIPAFAQLPRNIVLPPVGLAATETAEVNLVNVAAASSAGIAASCQGSVSFYDAGGSPIGASAAFTVGTGQIYSAKLPYASMGAAGPSTVVRAEIAPSLAPSTEWFVAAQTPPCELVFALETYDSATGITHALVSGSTAQGSTLGVLRNGRWR